MASGYSAILSLNRKSTGDTARSSCARFRTKDISIKNIYSSDLNFYPQKGIEQKAAEIQAVGLLSNLVVMHKPCDQGEYKLVSGERRWRALSLLVEQGYNEFEKVTCQIREPGNEHEEMIELILANSSRQKDTFTLAKEEQTLKRELEYMRDHDMKLNGYDLKEGRLRDVIADILNISKTKVAELEAISNRLIPVWKLQLEKDVLSSSVAYRISKLEPADQYSLYQRYPKGVTLADIQSFLDEMKKESEDALPEQSPQEQEDQLPGQMILSQDGECVESDTEVADRQAEPIEPDLESEAAVLPEQKADTTKQTEQSGNHATMNLPESRPVEKENLKDSENMEESAESEIFAAGEAGKERSLYDRKMKAIQKLIDEEMKSLKTLKNSPNIHAECAASSLAQEIILKHQIMLDAFILYKKRLEGSHEPK
ncbi:MAG: ParB N-terminal domain-containing protein [Lachnospiraceae bacterium]|nr:ParB N-terminal domain-containing protein [Lachnospiraceae bacterium]